MNSKKIIFKGGIPTDVDVNKLVDRIGIPEPGTIVDYDEIKAAIGINRSENRWYSVTTAWRKKLRREYNLELKAIANEGFMVLDPAGRVDYAAGCFKSGIRRIGRSAHIAEYTDRAKLNEEDRKVCEHLQRVAGLVRVTAATEARRLHYPDPEKEETKP